MNKLSQSDLKTLYLNFTRYRDTCCNGMADISVQDFYAKFGLSPHV